MGADVIKVEALTGDVGRSPLPSRSPDMGAGFINSNRNKRSIAIDLKQPRGLDVVLRLARSADALVHNMRPKAAQKLGVGYDELKALESGSRLLLRRRASARTVRTLTNPPMTTSSRRCAGSPA